MGFRMRHRFTSTQQGKAQAAKPVASTIRPTDPERALIWIHALLALLAPLLILVLSGCKSTDTGEAVDFGPETTEDAIDLAMVEAIHDVDPERIKVGAFVHFATKQILAGGQIQHIVADTGHTVIGAYESEDGNQIDYLVAENQITYGHEDGPRKVSTEFTISAARSTSSDALRSRSSDALSPFHWVEAWMRKLDESEALSLLSADVHPSVRQTSETTRTYHRLRTSTYEGPPPLRVQMRPNCLGLQNCKITYRKITFDEVYWTNGTGERVHYEFVVSPQAPPTAGYNYGIRYQFVPGLVKSCFTLMVSVGSGHSKTLLTQCQEVEDFRFESDPS